MTDTLTSHLRRSLGATHVIERELGGGGMSRVFLAEEVRLRRRVVIKVLSEELAATLSTERFEREIQMAARLQHPNIVPLLTAGDIDDLLYYTMPFVEGESLRERITRETRLSVPDALRIASEVMDALACAHRLGVVHRDIKPENILLSAGHAMVADFGIAKAISSSKTSTGNPDDAGLTQLGMSLGTPAYMSPEQAAGESDLDGRSDIYSTGCVLYEMLTGRQPFTGPSAAAIIAKRFMETPARVRASNPSISVVVDDAVMRAMAREPGDRFATAEEAHRALIDAAAAGSGEQHVASETPSIAVLPFTNVGSGSDDEYFADGMTEEVINALAHLSEIRVAARTSSFVFKGQRVDLRAIAEQLHVKTILEGSVRRAGNRVRISVQLISAQDGLHLWSERYDGELADVFSLQDDIAQSIAVALRQRLGSVSSDAASSVAMRERAPMKPEAYDIFLRGRFLFEQHNAIDALASFEQASALDPQSGQALAWLAFANILAANMNQGSALLNYPRARAAADRALELDPRLAEARIARAFVASWFDWDRVLSERIQRELLIDAAGVPTTHELAGWNAVTGGRFAEAIAEAAQAYAIDPLSDFMLYNTSLTFVLAGAHERAIEEATRGLARSPGNTSTLQVLGLALFAAGRLAEALAVVERSRSLGQPRQLQALYACILASTGELARARAELVELETPHINGGAAYELACGHHLAGDDDAAFRWLEHAFAERNIFMTFMHLDPRLRTLGADERFQGLVARVGIAP